MKLIIVRHGETIENREGICQGHLHGKLTKKGKEQARKLSERLAKEKFDIIFSSDLTRASNTAKEIAKFHQNIPFYLVGELRERFHGDLQGKKRKEVKGWEKEENREKILKDAGVESIEDLIKRAENFKNKIFKKLSDKKILWVTHGGFILALCSSILKKDWLEFHRTNPLKNTSITIFEFDKNKKLKLKLMNCVKHLEDL